MRQQSHIMRDEMVATQVAARAAQEGADIANRTLVQMMHEQRPWLCLGECKIRPTKSGNIKYKITAENTGPVPGMIAEYAVAPVVADKNDSMDDAIDEAFEDLSLEPQTFALAPGITFPFGGTFLGDKHDFRRIRDGTDKFAVIVVVRYCGTSDGDYVTKDCWIYDADDGELYTHPRYSQMT